MVHSLSILMFLLALPEGLDTRFEQVYPLPRVKEQMERTPAQFRAVLLIPGLRLHTFSNARVHQAMLHDWQAPSSHLVAALARNSDVYAFAYAQSVPVEVICQHPALGDCVEKLRKMGYSEIILIGHSAGAIVARMFVEDNPDAGVTRVIQVSAPNLGSSWAKTKEFTARKDQEPFLNSLTKDQRRKCLQRRQDKKIPANVEFLCVVGSTGNLGDGFVSIVSQWPEDLQNQGIPAVRMGTNHFAIVRASSTATRIAGLAFQLHPRWTEEERAARKRFILSHSTK